MKKTPWYPGTVKPVRVGWYETRKRPEDKFGFRCEVYMDWWDGFYFCDAETKNRLIDFDWSKSPYLQWRGLTEKSK